MKKWYFPYGKDIEKESVNNARIETFKDDILGSLAREVCQNSLDASLYDDKPVRVVFEEKEIETDLIPDIESFEDIIIPLSKETWINDDNAQEFLKGYEEILKKDKIKVLRISDYNTTGLKESNWESLIENAGTSFKNDISSAGSFGIGKAAPFASSDLRMVFYSTKLENGDEKSIGVNKFVSYDRKDGMTTQGVGYLGEKGKNPMKGQKTFNFEDRREIGTDIYIIGFNQEDDWNKDIIFSILESFMVAIHNENLIVNINNIEIDKNTIKDIMMELEGKKFDEIKNYYSVLIDDKAIKVNLDDRFKEYGFNEDDGYLLLSRGKDANRSVLMTRKAGMKIYDRKGFSQSIQFNGIFQATGELFNSMLQDMENPNHNKWVPERYEKNPKLAKKLLLDIFRFCRENIMDNYQEKIEKQIDAFGISEFLPNKLNKGEDDKGEDESGLDEKIKDVIVKPRETKGVRKEGFNTDEYEKKLIRQGIIDGDEQGSGSPKDTDTKNKGGRNRGGVGEPGGRNKKGENGRETSIEVNKSYRETKKYNVRIIEMDYRKGEYRLILNGKDHGEKIKIELNPIGENGSSYKGSIISAIDNKEKLEAQENYFVIYKPDKDLYKIDLQLPYNNRIKLGVNVYDYR